MSENKYNLTVGANFFIDGIKAQQPHLSAGNVEVAANVLLTRIGQGMSQGAQPALLIPTPDGDFESTVLFLGPLTGGGGEK